MLYGPAGTGKKHLVIALGVKVSYSKWLLYISFFKLKRGFDHPCPDHRNFSHNGFFRVCLELYETIMPLNCN